MRNAFINTILEACKYRNDIFIISGDAGLGVFDIFKEEHPDRFLNLGAAEQNMIGVAAGLAMTGYKVVVYNIIPFVLYRCYEQVRNDICYQGLPIILVGIGSGLSYAPQGMTHYSVEDLGLACTMPNLNILSPIDPVEAQLAAAYALSANEPVYVRLAKRGEPELHTTCEFDITQPQVLHAGHTVALLCHGSIANEVIDAGKMLTSNGITPLIISIPLLQPLNANAVVNHLKNIKYIITIEEHYISCGLGNLLREIIMTARVDATLITLGVSSQFIHAIHDTAGMRKMFKMDAASITELVTDLWHGNSTVGTGLTNKRVSLRA